MRYCRAPCLHARTNRDHHTPSNHRAGESSPSGRATIGLLAPAIALVLGAAVALSGARGTDWPGHIFRIELFRTSV